MAILVRKRTSARKQESVDVLRKSLIPAEQVPIIRDSPENHVALQHLGSGHDQSLRLGETFAFAKVERPEIDVTRKSVVQSANISVDLSDDP